MVPRLPRRLPIRRIAFRRSWPQPDDTKLVEELFVAILDRFPQPAESTAGVAAINAAKEEYANLQAKLDTFEREQLPARQAAWEKAQQPVAWTPLAIAGATSAGGAMLALQADGAIAASGPSPEVDQYTILGTTQLAGITALRIEALADPSLPAGGPDAPNGNFVLGNVRVSAAPVGDLAAGKTVALQGGVADFSQEGYPVVNAIDGDAKSGWAVMTQSRQAAHGDFRNRRSPRRGRRQRDFARARATLWRAAHAGAVPNFGHRGPAPVKLDTLPSAVADALAIMADKRTPEQQVALSAYYRTQDAEWTCARAPRSKRLAKRMGNTDCKARQDFLGR